MGVDLDRIVHAIKHSDTAAQYWSDANLERLAGCVLNVMKNPSESTLRASLVPTSAWRDIKGSALTVNLEKARLRWNAMIGEILK